MADRIVVMHDGVVQQVGTPLELYDRPANMFVAGFIGSPAMNFLPATVDKGGKADAVLADGQKLRLPDGLPLKDGDAITVGLRPEHIRLAEDGALQGEVEVVEPLGLSTQFYVKLAGQQALRLCHGAQQCQARRHGAAVGRSGGAASVRSGKRRSHRLKEISAAEGTQPIASAGGALQLLARYTASIDLRGLGRFEIDRAGFRAARPQRRAGYLLRYLGWPTSRKRHDRQRRLLKFRSRYFFDHHDPAWRGSFGLLRPRRTGGFVRIPTARAPLQSRFRIATPTSQPNAVSSSHLV